MLRITIESEGVAVPKLILEGRIAGPWVDELDRVWADASSKLAGKKIEIDVRNVTYANAAGKEVLRKIVTETHAELLTGGLSTQDLADEVIGKAHKQ